MKVDEPEARHPQKRARQDLAVGNDRAHVRSEILERCLELRSARSLRLQDLQSQLESVLFEG